MSDTQYISLELMLKKCRVAFQSQNENQQYEIFIIKDTIQTFEVASLSVVLSCAAYILKLFPTLPHPTIPTAKPPNDRIDTQFPSPYMSLSPLFDCWAALLSQAFFEGNAYRQNQTLYLKVKVSKQFAAGMKDLGVQYSTFPKSQTLSEVFKVNQQFSQKKIGWMNVSTSQLNKQIFHPHVNTISILLGQVYNNQRYEMFYILKGHIPTVEELLNFDAIIIPGSGLSVLSNVQNIQLVSKNILSAYRKSQKLKILGICYGHQLIAQIFGAKVVKRDRYGGIQSVSFHKQVVKQYKFLEPLSKYEECRLTLSEHHEDFVTTVPKQQLIQLAVSKSCENEAFVSKNGRIFTTQFHPEYLYPYTKAYVARMRSFFSPKIAQKPAYSHSSKQLQQHIQHSEDIRRCIQNFL